MKYGKIPTSSPAGDHVVYPATVPNPEPPPETVVVYVIYNHRTRKYHGRIFKTKKAADKICDQLNGFDVTPS